jgi:hypothetical protein
MLKAIKENYGKSVIISLDLRKSKEFLEAGQEGSFLGTIVSADEVGIYTLGFLTRIDEQEYRSQVAISPEDSGELLDTYTEAVVIPWHAIVGITFVK